MFWMYGMSRWCPMEKKIIEERENFVSRLGLIVAEIHSRLTGGREEISIRYEKNVDAASFEEALKRGRRRICGLR